MGQLIHVRSLSTQERFKQNLQGGPRSGSVKPCWKMALPRGSLGASLAKLSPHFRPPPRGRGCQLQEGRTFVSWTPPGSRTRPARQMLKADLVNE